MNVSTDAIILRTINYLESSKIVYAYTKEYGKQTFVAKGALRAKSKFGSSLELCSVVDLKYYKKSNREMYNLTNAELIRKSFIDKLPFVDKILCLMMCEAIYKLDKDDNPDEYFYSKLEYLIDISCSERVFNYAMFIGSQIELANSIGHSIHLRWDNSGIIDYSDDNEVFLDISNCKIYLDNSIRAERRLRFKIEELKIIKEIASGNLDVEISENTLRRIVYLFESYFSFHNESRFNYNSFSLINV